MTRAYFDLIPGVVSDETAFSIGNTWSDASNVRFVNARPQAIGGWTAYNATALGDVCRNALSFTDLYNAINVAFGTVSTLEVENSGTIYNITPASFVSGYEDSTMGASGFGAGGFGMGGFGIGPYDQYARVWSLATWGENLLACPRLDTVYIWTNDTAAVATVITNAPDAIISMLVPPDSRQIRTFGCTDTSGVFNHSCVRGCVPEDYTDWTPSSSNNAFEVIIEGGSPIVRALTFADRDAIWTQSGVHLGTFVGGTQKYRIDLVASGCGLAGFNAVCIHNKVAYWLSPDLRFFAWPFGGVPQEIPCPISEDFRDNIDTDQIIKTVATAIGKYGEIWWLYTDGRDDDENSRYVSFHIDESARAGVPVWSRGNVARTAAINSAELRYPLMVDVAGATFLHENTMGANGGTLTWYVTTGGLALGDADRRYLIRDIRPDIKDQTGTVSVTVTAYDYPQDSSATTFGPYSLAANDNKYDFMAEGRWATIKYGGSATSTYARIDRPSFDIHPTGRF